MTIENDIFKKQIPNFKKLLEYGFCLNETEYYYEKIFMNNEFKAVIKILNGGIILGKVFDLENDDEFLPLKIDVSQGAFVAEVREEYKKILTDIKDKCFSEIYFVFSQTNRITNLIIQKYGDYPDFMWENFPNYGVFKNADNNKWYGIIMNINYSKLGLNNNKSVEIINLKLYKEKIQELLKKEGFYPAWHMNKKYWITIVLDETISDDTIMDLVAESYSYTLKQNKSKYNL